MEELMTEFRYQRAITILEKMLSINLITPVVYDPLTAKYQNRYASDIAKHKRR